MFCLRRRAPLSPTQQKGEGISIASPGGLRVQNPACYRTARRRANARVPSVCVLIPWSTSFPQPAGEGEKERRSRCPLSEITSRK